LARCNIWNLIRLLHLIHLHVSNFDAFFRWFLWRVVVRYRGCENKMFIFAIFRNQTMKVLTVSCFKSEALLKLALLSAYLVHTFIRENSWRKHLNFSLLVIWLYFSNLNTFFLFFCYGFLVVDKELAVQKLIQIVIKVLLYIFLTGLCQAQSI